MQVKAIGRKFDLEFRKLTSNQTIGFPRRDSLLPGGRPTYSSDRGTAESMDGEPYLKTGTRAAVVAGRRSSTHRPAAVSVTSTDGQRNTPAPFAQSTPYGPKTRPTSEARIVVTENSTSAARTVRRVRSGWVGSLRMAPAAHSMSTKLT